MAIKEKLLQIMAGTVTAEQNISQFLKKISTENEKLNIFLHMNPDAIAQAKSIDAKIAKGDPVGKLAGLGIAIKSNICVEGIITNCASKTLQNYTATYDADVISAIKREDGIIIGMVNQDEFACGGSGETSAFGKCENPAAPGHIPGGSSSGSAAAVAADFCDISLGSDTGGSIRNPASHCGIVGIKPSYGRVSRYGLIDLSMSLDQIGPLCKDVYGCALMMEVISGLSENDASTSAVDVETYSESSDASSLRIGVSSDFEKLCTDKRILEKVMTKISDVKTTEVSIPHIDLAIQTYYPIVYVEIYSGTRKFDGRRYGMKIEDTCGDEVLRRILGGREISKAEHNGKYYRTALAVKEDIEKQIAKAFETVDIIVLPTTPILPHKFDEDISVEAMYSYDAFTIPANLAGICAGVIPAGTIDGIPVGLQVFAKKFAEKDMFNFLFSLEKK